VLELDSAVHNEYANHLMQQNPIPINYTSYITQLQAIANGTIACNITRSCSRLKSIFVNFDKSAINYGTNDARALMKKSWNTFYHPMMMGFNGRAYNSDKELEMHVLVGNKPFPQQYVTFMQDLLRGSVRVVDLLLRAIVALDH
jgi:hypothetical protein